MEDQGQKLEGAPVDVEVLVIEVIHTHLATRAGRKLPGETKKATAMRRPTLSRTRRRTRTTTPTTTTTTTTTTTRTKLAVLDLGLV